MSDKIDNGIFSTPIAESETTLGEGQSDESSVDSGEALTAETEADTGETNQGDEQKEPAEDDVEIIYDVDGEEVTLKQLKEWKAGQLRLSDYTKKTQAIAEDRKTITKQKQAVDAAMSTLGAVIGDIESELLGELNKVNWSELLDTDPSEYLRMRETEKAKRGKIAEIVGKYESLADQKAKAESAELHKSLGWEDQSKKTADLKRIEEYAKANGMVDDITSINNHKVMIAMLDAAKYRELQTKKAGVIKQVKAAPKVVTKPGASQKSTEQPTSLADMLYGGKSN